MFAKPSAQVKDAIAAAHKEKELYARIGQLHMELDWLKKSWRARELKSVAA